MVKKIKILIVEDETAIADIIAFNLEREGYQTETAYDGKIGLQKALEEHPDLILLDVMLPEMDGFDVCRRVRQQYDMPILMLTAREEENDKIEGLELGADDYITKPFSMRELVARVRANVRRVTTTEVEERALVGDLTITEEKNEICKNGKPLDLSVREYEIMAFLATAPDKVFSREELMEKVWGYDYYGDLRAVDVAIRRLREKVEDNPARPQYIITKRGLGYYLSSGK